MKTFEEKWTAWLDGELSGKELAEFEASLPDPHAAAQEKREAQQLGRFLKEQLSLQTMANADFFQHQLREEIARERALATPARPAAPVAAGWWSIGRLLWMGASAMAVFALCTFFILRDQPNAGRSSYLTQIQNARIDPVTSPDATVSVFETKEDRVTVIWMSGLEMLPSEYAAK